VRRACASPSSPWSSAGQRFTQVLDDDWTVVTSDGSRASHWEHTVAVLEDGIWVLTAADGGALGRSGAARRGAIAPARLRRRYSQSGPTR
jgi:methionyl aminopeptidase